LRDCKTKLGAIADVGIHQLQSRNVFSQPRPHTIMDRPRPPRSYKSHNNEGIAQVTVFTWCQETWREASGKGMSNRIFLNPTTFSFLFYTMRETRSNKRIYYKPPRKRTLEAVRRYPNRAAHGAPFAVLNPYSILRLNTNMQESKSSPTPTPALRKILSTFSSYPSPSRRNYTCLMSITNLTSSYISYLPRISQSSA
jgi:hypothetical protein